MTTTGLACRVCRVVDPPSGFVLRRGRPYQTLCRACDRERSRNYYLRHRKGDPKYRQYVNKRVRDQESIKLRAACHLRNAVHKGAVVKPTHCQDCGLSLPKAQIHGHHPDYTKPLDVIWVCMPCHGKRHRKYA